MADEDIWSWSTTAAANGTADTGISWPEGQARATVNNSARAMMAAHAKDRNLRSGTIVTAGAANVQTFASGVGYTNIPTGLRVLLKIGVQNTGPTTLNMDATGPVAVKSASGAALIGSELALNSYAEFLYDGTNWTLLSAPPPSAALNNGSIVTAGTADVQTFTTGSTYLTIPTGFRVMLKIGPGLTNTGPLTLNMDGVGAVAVKGEDGSDLSAGDVIAGTYVDFLYDGTNWILLGQVSASVVIQNFTASGTYTPSPGLTFCVIECVGGGGGGGGSQGAVDGYFGGGGGGSGGYSRKSATATDIGASQVVTIGAAGTIGGFAGTGGSGGVTSVGTLCVANGGLGGGGASPGVGNPNGGAGGAAGTGDIAAAGAPGGHGQWINAPGLGLVAVGVTGHGGSSYFGGGGRAVISASSAASGIPGRNYGSGGGGGGTANFAGNAFGSTGSAGFVVITEYCL